MSGYKELADDLRRRIDSGEFSTGETLPKITHLMEEYGLARQTVRDAIGLLADEGLVVAIRKRGTVVRHRTPVRVPLSRYRQTVTPGGTKGPWETATAAQGLNGHMKLIDVIETEADDALARLLEVSLGADLICRRRHALIHPDDVVQIQHAWYPQHIAKTAGIAGTAKIVGGIYRALTVAGHPPATATETVRSRTPTKEEASKLCISGKVSVLTIERVTKDRTGRPLEVLRVVGPADRIELCYDDLPLTPE